MTDIKAPWVYRGSSTGSVHDRHGNLVASVFGDDPECKADDLMRSRARLIAAAPELLEALQLADAMLSGANMNASVVERKVREAIAKTTGEHYGR